MIPDSANPVIQKAVGDMIIKNEWHVSNTVFDTDDVVYYIEGNEEQQCVLFSYRGNDTATIMQNGGQEMLDLLYKEYQCDASLKNPNYDITLKVAIADLPQTQKVKKSLSEEEQEKVREENEVIRAKRKDIVDPVATRIANFKMNWLSAPIRRYMSFALQQKQNKGVEIKYRATEKYWVVMPEANSI